MTKPVIWSGTAKNRPKDGQVTKVTRALMSREFCDSYNGGSMVNLRRTPLWMEAMTENKALSSVTSFTVGDVTGRCVWRIVGSSMVCDLHRPAGVAVPAGFPHRDIDFLHAAAHVLTPADAALHGIEFVETLVALTTDHKMRDRYGKRQSKANSKKLLKTVLLANKIKTFRKAGKPQMSTDDMVAEIVALHEMLGEQLSKDDI